MLEVEPNKSIVLTHKEALNFTGSWGDSTRDPRAARTTG